MVFGQALTRALDRDTLQDALRHYLLNVVGSGGMWVFLRSEGRWEPMVDSASQMPMSTVEALANRLLSGDQDTSGSGFQWEGHFCCPLRVGDSTLGLLGVTTGSVVVTESQRQKLAALAALVASAINNVQLFRETCELSMSDSLTGCFNHAHALKAMDAEARRADRSGLPLSIIMFDIDHFKHVNDQHGHLCGDAVLVMVGNRLKEFLRNSDVRCRYGGEEFLLILPDTPLAGAMHLAEWLRGELARTHVTCGDGKTLSVTAIIARADAALYQAKHAGRNCVRCGAGEAADAAANARIGAGE